MITKIFLNIYSLSLLLIKFLLSPSFFKSNPNLIKVTIKYFRDKNDRHPQIIIDEIEDRYISIGITHEDKKGKSKKAGKNKKLDFDPLGSKTISYARRQANVFKKKLYEGDTTGYLSENDYKTLQYYSDKAKKKYLKEKSSNTAKKK